MSLHSLLFTPFPHSTFIISCEEIQKSRFPDDLLLEFLHVLIQYLRIFNTTLTSILEQSHIINPEYMLTFLFGSALTIKREIGLIPR